MRKGFLSILLLSGIMFCTLGANASCNHRNYDDYYAKKAQRYDYMYRNPPRPSLKAYGRYIMVSSGVRYVHSPSKHKAAQHAARIDAYNYDLNNF